MATPIWAHLVVLLALAGGCSARSASAAPGQIVVAVTVDWEGAELSPDGLDALDELRRRLGAVPLTHFIAAAYLTKDRSEPAAVAASIARSLRSGDELAVHLHAWRSLAKASKLEPKLSPSFLTGTDKLLTFDDGDIGFDTDLDAYGVPELRALLRTSRRLLELTRAPVSRSFRAGGYLGTPKVLQAIREEGFTVDSSATDFRRLDERRDGVFASRIQAIWPTVESTSQPWQVPGPTPLLEMPIAAIADYATVAQITAGLDAALVQLRAAPGRDVFVVLGLHLETAAEFAGRIGDAVARARGQPALAGRMVFLTVEAAAARAGAALRR